MPEISLRPHTSTPCPWISAITARVDWLSDDLLVFYYQIEGDIDRLQLPAQQRSAHTDGLWRRTCFEAFVRPRGVRNYFEFNFSPSSEWAVYRFEDYRRSMQSIECAHPPKIICRRREGELDADVDVHLGALDIPPHGELQMALAAVLEDQQGAISYWALAHPEGKPDFHHEAGFTLTLPRTAGVK
ncbi:MAG: DOMON-like domain-containing protein [Steroidobacter sp.]